jgi:hypothetical protein
MCGVVRLADVDLRHALDEGEGEGDESVAQWRAGHARSGCLHVARFSWRASRSRMRVANVSWRTTSSRSRVANGWRATVQKRRLSGSASATG